MDASKSVPMPLIRSRGEKPVLDWILAAFRNTGIDAPIFVGGYHVEKVVEFYPNLEFVYHRRWQDEGEVAALALTALADADATVVVRADTILMAEALDALLSSSAPVSAGFHGNARRFSGAIVVSKGHANLFWERARKLAARSPKASLIDLLTEFRETNWIDLTNLATPVDDPEALYETVFAGKGRTLAQLSSVARRGVVLDQVRFTTAQWRAGQGPLVQNVISKFSPGKVIVRSSTRGEDRVWTAAAGVFHTEPDVPSHDVAALVHGVETVIASYERDGRSIDPADEVLIQPQLEGVRAAGVLFTRDPNSGSPYFLLNIESISGRADVVTSGGKGHIEAVYVSWLAPMEMLQETERQALALARELIDLTHLDALDIEFSIGPDGRCYLFQVRPLFVARSTRIDLDQDLHLLLEEARTFVDARTRSDPTLLGDRTVLGNMPDWNPAEMLGVAPRPLALSLYQTLIGERAWSKGRAELGYRDAGPHPLILSIGGRPYVDVRASLNSFLPAALSDDIGTRWINHCVDYLSANPRLHDKLEFEITVTCAGLDPSRDESTLARAELPLAQRASFLSALRELTAAVVKNHAKFRRRNVADMAELGDLVAKLGRSPVSVAPEASYRIVLLLETCRAKGIVPFVIAARKAFIAVHLLRSLVTSGACSQEDVDAIQRSVPTVATELLSDLDALTGGSLDESAFLAKYGHVRPGSYDIKSRNYASCWKEIVAGGKQSGNPVPADPREGLAIVRARWAAIEPCVRRSGIDFSSPEHLFGFVMESIADREWVKFQFMKAVDAVLESITVFGGCFNLDRDGMSFLQISEVARYAHDSASGATGDRLSRTIGYRRKRQELSEALHLPDLIRDSRDLLVVRLTPGTPNFVTKKRVEAPIVFLDDRDGRDSLQGAIVAIRAADPGYDWIFSQGIVGLVTEYGGMASHMAIRAAEFGLAAAVGCGTVLFDQLKGAKMVELDCAQRRLRRVS